MSPGRPIRSGSRLSATGTRAQSSESASVGHASGIAIEQRECCIVKHTAFVPQKLLFIATREDYSAPLRLQARSGLPVGFGTMSTEGAFHNGPTHEHGAHHSCSCSHIVYTAAMQLTLECNAKHEA